MHQRNDERPVHCTMYGRIVIKDTMSSTQLVANV